MTAVQHELKDLYDIDPNTGLPVNPLTKHVEKIKSIKKDIDELPWPLDSSPEQLDALSLDENYAEKLRLLKNKMANERNSILASRGNQNSTTLLRHLDTKDHKEVLRHFKSDKKAGSPVTSN